MGPTTIYLTFSAHLRATCKRATDRRRYVETSKFLNVERREERGRWQIFNQRTKDLDPSGLFFMKRHEK